MIKKETYKTREDGVKLFRIYSDTNHKIMQKPTMVVYDEAIDIEGAPYEYEETDELIETTTEAIEAYDYRVGYPNKLEF